MTESGNSELLQKARNSVSELIRPLRSFLQPVAMGLKTPTLWFWSVSIFAIAPAMSVFPTLVSVPVMNRPFLAGKFRFRGIYSSFTIFGSLVSIAFFIVFRSRSSSSLSMASGGMMTITSDNGRSITPSLRMAEQSFVPNFFSFGKDCLFFLSFTSSIPAIIPHWRVSPTKGKPLISSR